MKILMMTNVYTPFVGGVTRSIQSFRKGLKKQGNDVLVIAPAFKEAPHAEEGVLRTPSITHMLNGPFSLPMPMPTHVYDAVERFRPDIIHSHHPFFLGSTALRMSSMYDLPVVYTHHTRYDKYGHYIKDSPRLNEMLLRLADKYSDICDTTVAPTPSMAALLRSQGVSGRIEVVPTGIDTHLFTPDDGNRSVVRARHGIPESAFVVGHVGRLSQEKNLSFLGEALALFLAKHPEAHVLVAGEGKEESVLRAPLARTNTADRMHHAGSLQGQALADAYHAMDCFAFSSKSETQGIVVVEALASGVPVVALDAVGVRDVVRDGLDGILLNRHEKKAFARALGAIMHLPESERHAMRKNARRTGEEYAEERCAQALSSVYASVIAEKRTKGNKEMYASQWMKLLKQLEREWQIVGNVMSAAFESLMWDGEEEEDS